MAPSVAIATGRPGFVPVLRSADPFPPEFDAFLTRKFAAAHLDGPATSLSSAVPLGALLTDGEPWPADLALLLVRRVAVLLDTADGIGVMIGTFTPDCIALYGPHVVLARHDDRAGLDPAYIAPEQLQPGTPVDARASQYGLALVAATLLASVRLPSVRRERDVRTGLRARVMGGLHAGRGRPAADMLDPQLGSTVRQVLHTARDANPERRFPSARAFATALERAYADWWWEVGRGMTAGPGARWSERQATAHSADLAPGGSRTLAKAGMVVTVVLSVVAAAGWYAAQHPAVVPPELRNDSAGARVVAAPTSPSAALPAPASALPANALLDSMLLNISDQAPGGPSWDANAGPLGIPHPPVVARSDARDSAALWVGSKPTLLRYLPPERDGRHFGQTVEQTFRFVSPR